MSELLLTLSEKDRDALAGVRTIPGLRASADEGIIWLRGIPAAGEQDIRIRQLPGLQYFRLGEKDYLFPLGGITPTSRLKQLNWVPVKEFIKVTLPVSSMPGSAPRRIRIRLAATAHSHEPQALLTDLETWKAYAETASAARLNPLKFAVAEDGQVMITGFPPPPIPGKQHHLRHNILFPCGYDFEPPGIAELIAGKLNPEKNAILLFDRSGHWERIPMENFVQASRSAVRNTVLTTGGES